MGFAPGRVEAAVRNAGDSVETAVQWLEENQARMDERDRERAAAGQDPDDYEGAELETLAARARKAAGKEEPVEGDEAATTEEKKPLTQEEIDAKLAVLREKAEIRKAEQAKKDAEERKKNELLMMKRNKDTLKAAEDLEKKKAQQAAADRRREAREDAEAKRRIRELIEADKRARREKQQQASNASSAAGSASNPSSASASTDKPAAKPAAARSAPTESRLRIRVERNNTQIMKTYKVETTLASVAGDLAPEVGIPAPSILFVTTFPTRTIGHAEFGQTLKEAGLVNASVIVRSA